MKNIRKLYGNTIIRLDNLNFNDCTNEFKIEYYKIVNLEKTTEDNKFGIEVLKRTMLENNEIIEKKEILNFLDTEEKADRLLNILQRNKVTPISVEDIVEDFKFEIKNSRVI